MSNQAIRPSTMDGIKSLAKEFKRERKLSHAQSLNEAARQAGFENFRHAQNKLPLTKRVQAVVSQPLYITAYWRDRDGLRGRETLKIELSAPWQQLVTKAQMKHHRALMDFRGDAPDHLERGTDINAQDNARSAVCAVARTMQFIDATKLRPASRLYRAFHNIYPKLPGLDHSSDWIDPATSRMLVMDEPYEPPVGRMREERLKWAREYGFRIETPDWAGLYAPGHSVMHLITQDGEGIPLDPLVGLLNALPPPIVSSGWSGESAPHSPVFNSPGRKAMRTKKRERPDPFDVLRRYGNSVGHVRTFVGPQRRPDASMPIPAHQEVGQLLKSLLSTCSERSGVRNQISGVRGELDEWIQREYDDTALPQETFNQVYYGEGHVSGRKSLSEAERNDAMEKFDRVAAIVSSHYPDCAPLRSLLRSIHSAKTALKRWQ